MKSSNALRMIADAIQSVADESEDMSHVEAVALVAFANQLRAVSADMDEQEKSLRNHLLAPAPVASPLYKERPVG